MCMVNFGKVSLPPHHTTPHHTTPHHTIPRQQQLELTQLHLVANGVNRSFDRTFLLTAAPAQSRANQLGFSLVIVNDQLHIRSYTASSRIFQQPSTPASTPATPLPAYNSLVLGSPPSSMSPSPLFSIQPSPIPSPTRSVIANTTSSNVRIKDNSLSLSFSFSLIFSNISLLPGIGQQACICHGSEERVCPTMSGDQWMGLREGTEAFLRLEGKCVFYLFASVFAFFRYSVLMTTCFPIPHLFFSRKKRFRLRLSQQRKMICLAKTKK